MAQVITSTSPRLRMCGISKRFGATVALDSVSLDVNAGEVVALVGENGAGKSTLMKVLSGAHAPDGGRMLLEGRPFCPAHPLEARRAGVAMIYQELSLAPHLTVESNILLGMEPAKWGWIRQREVRRVASDALRRLGHQELDPNARVADLPIAAQQVVEIARALAVGCSILVLDEPTSSLTSRDVVRLFELIRELKAQRLSVIYISHFLEEVKEIADRIVVLRDGGVVGEGAATEMNIPQMVALMVGREVNELYVRSRRVPGEVLLETDQLSGQAKPVSASLKLRRGEVLGIGGLMGAGRTELLRCLFGLDAVRKGTVRVGVWCGPASPLQRWGQGVGFLSEDRKQEGLAVSLSVADNITMSRRKGLGPPGLVLPRRQAAAANRWIQRLNIRCRGPFEPVATLSGGNQQKVALARLLEHDVDVMLLDEPTRGIDVGAKATVYRIIDELAVGSPNEQRAPRAILMVSSYLPELIGVCDRIGIMCRGRLGIIRAAGEIDEHQLMLEATGQETADIHR